ncbi:MAG: hypothetical protein WCQ89_18205 [Verrucomicrobiota bacterium]
MKLKPVSAGASRFILGMVDVTRDAIRCGLRITTPAVLALAVINWSVL